MVQRRLSHAVTAIDIALEPDATMVRRAEADNARLLKAYPQGFALDATHHAHITMLQQFVRTADFENVYSAANVVFAKERAAIRRLKAIKYYYIPSPPLGIAGIVVKSTEDLLRLQCELQEAVAPSTEKTGPAAAYRLRRQFHHGGGRQKFQSARHNWRRPRDLPQRDARGTVRGVHVFTGGRGCLPTRHFLAPRARSSGHCR